MQMAVPTNILGEEYITLDNFISKLQDIHNRYPGKDIRVCYSEDKMNGVLDRIRISDYVLCSDNVLEIT